MVNYRNTLVKFYSLEYDLYIDLLDSVILRMKDYSEDKSSLESGGVLFGYKVKGSNCIVIDDLSEPDQDDFRSKFRFIRKSKIHIIKILSKREERSFCVGNWHTHPFANIPNPSSTDLLTWNEELYECKSSFGYQLFVVCGKNGFRIWIGKENQDLLYELKECEKIDGLYVRRQFNE